MTSRTSITPTENAGPRRIQRKRTKGWRMPEGAVYVGRPTEWGNPYKVGAKVHVERGYSDSIIRVTIDEPLAVALLRAAMESQPYPARESVYRRIREHLRGKDLVCWCSLDQPCHADVLLEIANAA